MTVQDRPSSPLHLDFANSFPFLYQGLEHEISDPGQLYFEPSGNVYNPQIQRELSLIGPQGIFGPPSGFGNGGFSSPSGQGNGHQTGQSLGQTGEPASNGGIFRYMPGKPNEPFMLP